jgi:hypothetical protein
MRHRRSGVRIAELISRYGLRHSACLFCLVGAASGCQVSERARACGRVSSALNVAEPPKARTSDPDELEQAAKEFAAAAKRLSSIGTLPPELDAIVESAQRALTTQAQVTTAAARARQVSQPEVYADARLRADQTRKVLLDLKARFDKLCAR